MRTDSSTALAAVSLSKSVRKPPLGLNTSSIDSSGKGISTSLNEPVILARQHLADYGSRLETMQVDPGDSRSSRLDGMCDIAFDECALACDTSGSAKSDCA